MKSTQFSSYTPLELFNLQPTTEITSITNGSIIEMVQPNESLVNLNVDSSTPTPPKFWKKYGGWILLTGLGLAACGILYLNSKKKKNK